MKATRRSVEEYAKEKGLTLIERDGIPTGFLWLEPDVSIGNVLHKGRVVRFEPLKELKPIYE